MTPAVVIRPQPGNAASVAGLWAKAVTARGFPLFRIAPVAWEPLEPGDFDALLVGSANALRHVGSDLARYRGKPAYAVGEATAAACRAAGLAVVGIAEGGLQEVLARVAPRHARLLRLTGRERVALAPPVGVSMIERIVYCAESLPLPPPLAVLLQTRAVVLLHSAAAARHFAGECGRLGVSRAPLSLAAIGPRVAEAAGDGWALVAAAERPTEQALLALARQLCQERSA